MRNEVVDKELHMYSCYIKELLLRVRNVGVIRSMPGNVYADVIVCLSPPLRI